MRYSVPLNLVGCPSCIRQSCASDLILANLAKKSTHDWYRLAGSTATALDTALFNWTQTQAGKLSKSTIVTYTHKLREDLAYFGNKMARFGEAFKTACDAGKFDMRPISAMP